MNISQEQLKNEVNAFVEEIFVDKDVYLSKRNLQLSEKFFDKFAAWKIDGHDIFNNMPYMCILLTVKDLCLASNLFDLAFKEEEKNSLMLPHLDRYYELCFKTFMDSVIIYHDMFISHNKEDEN